MRGSGGRVFPIIDAAGRKTPARKTAKPCRVFRPAVAQRDSRPLAVSRGAACVPLRKETVVLFGKNSLTPLLAAGLVLATAGAAPADSNRHDAARPKLVVHEWGTFLTVQGS